MSLKFYSNRICPFVQRVAIVLAEKKIAHESVHIDLVNMPEWYVRDINPRHTVPALAVGDEILHESLPIAHYLDATKAPLNALFPADSAVRARIRGFQALCGDVVGAFYGALRAKPEEQAAANANLRTVAAKVENAIAISSAGPFFLGSIFSMADVTIVPFLLRFRVLLPAYAGVELYEAAPALHRMLLAALQRESVTSTAPDAAGIVQAYTGYSNGKKARGMLQLRGAKGDPFTQSVQLAAAAKGIELEYVATKEDTVVLAPLGEAPIASTGFALQHLEDLHPEPALADATSHAAAAALTHSALVFSQVSDELATFAYQQVAADDAELKAALTTIEGLVRGPFCAGAVPTQGDYLLAAVVKKLPAGATAAFPKVAAAFEGVKALPKVAKFNDW